MIHIVNVKEDLTGQRFGRLVVTGRAKDYISPKERSLPQWLCKCDCGNDVVVLGNNLKRKTVISCGCYSQECRHMTKNKRYNTYDLSGDYGIGYTSKGKEFYFDLEDYDLIKDYCWCIDAKGYVCASPNTLLMHRVVTQCPDMLMVDHIHGKETRNDNRKSNLRICTNQQNNFNKGLRKDNTSGITGVSWNKRDKVWVVTMRLNGKSRHLGQFTNFNEAIKIRKLAEEKYFGEFSYDNSQLLD